MDLARSSQDRTSQILALRGFIKMIGMVEEPDGEKKVVLYRKALELAGDSADEKRQILAGVSNVRNVLALNMAGEMLEDASVAAEAQAAVVRIAGRIWRDHPDETLLVLKKISEKVTDEEEKAELEAFIERIENR